jgi:hypothetical protein
MRERLHETRIAYVANRSHTPVPADSTYPPGRMHPLPPTGGVYHPVWGV